MTEPLLHPWHSFSEALESFRAAGGLRGRVNARASRWITEKVDEMLQHLRKELEDFACSIESSAMSAAAFDQTPNVQFALRDLRSRVAAMQNQLRIGRAALPDALMFVHNAQDLWMSEVATSPDAGHLAESVTAAVDYLHDYLVAYEYVPTSLATGDLWLSSLSFVNSLRRAPRQFHVEDVEVWVTSQPQGRHTDWVSTRDLFGRDHPAIA